jgi:hypothetical protein
MGIRDWMSKLDRLAEGGMDSFELLDGTDYYYDAQEAYKTMFLHAVAVETGEAEEPPAIWEKIAQARNPGEVLARFAPESPDEFVDVTAAYDRGALITERRLVLRDVEEVEDLSEE